MGGATGVCGLCGFGCDLCLLSFCVSWLRVSGLVAILGFGVGIRFLGLAFTLRWGCWLVVFALGLNAWGWVLEFGLELGCGLDSGLLFG